MNIRASVFIAAVIIVLPFIIYSFISDLTKRQSLFIFGILVLFGSLASTADGWNALLWITQSRRLVPLLLSSGAVLAAALFYKRVTIRRHARELTWREKPSQREFAAACYQFLRRKGWAQWEETSGTSVNIYWVQMGKERVTVIVNRDNFQYELLRRMFTSSRLKPTKTVVVVLWAQPSEAIQNHLEDLGWRYMTIQEFRMPDADITSKPTPAQRQASLKNSMNSWITIKGGASRTSR